MRDSHPADLNMSLSVGPTVISKGLARILGRWEEATPSTHHVLIVFLPSGEPHRIALGAERRQGLQRPGGVIRFLDVRAYHGS